MTRGEGFGDLAEFYQDDMPLTIRGKVYRVPDPDVETGLYCQSIWAAGFDVFAAQERGDEPTAAQIGQASLSDNAETSLYVRILTRPIYDQMIADGLSWGVLKHAATTCFMWIVVGEDAAKDFWQRRPLGAATAPNRETRRRAQKASTSTAADSTTPQASSTSGTRSRQTSSPRQKVKAAPSRGKRS